MTENNKLDLSQNLPENEFNIAVALVKDKLNKRPKDCEDMYNEDWQNYLYSKLGWETFEGDDGAAFAEKVVIQASKTYIPGYGSYSENSNGSWDFIEVYFDETVV